MDGQVFISVTLWFSSEDWSSLENEMQINVSNSVLRELEYIVELHRMHSAPNPMDSVDTLIGYVLASIADGSRRPGSWERGMLEQMGLIADCDEHYAYRAHYGKKVPE